MDLSNLQIRNADVDENGEVSVEDAQLILKYYTQNTVAGKAVTWDELLGAKPAASLPKRHLLPFLHKQ